MLLDINEARQFFADFFYGEHHLPSKIRSWGEGWYVYMRGELATYDFNGLTRLVIMSHDQGIRASIQHHSPGYMKLMLHKRDPADQTVSLRHPTLENAIDAYRSWAQHNLPTYKIRPQDVEFVVEQPKKRKRRRRL